MLGEKYTIKLKPPHAVHSKVRPQLQTPQGKDTSETAKP